MIDLTERILLQVGRYMLGNVVTSALAGLATFLWCVGMDVPYAAALGVFVALMDMVPVVGSTIGGVVVSLVALAVSFLVAVITACFYIGFRLAEDYLIMPKAMSYAVNVHPIVTVVAVVIGGALLGGGRRAHRHPSRGRHRPRAGGVRVSPDRRGVRERGPATSNAGAHRPRARRHPGSRGSVR
ncbi:hypothetical protein GCM10020000_77490 [Streptomyces olivoverticillatus]